MLGFDVTDVIWFCTLQPRALSWLPNYYLSGFHLPRLWYLAFRRHAVIIDEAEQAGLYGFR
jgi:hypothetical protein